MQRGIFGQKTRSADFSLQSVVKYSKVRRMRYTQLTNQTQCYCLVLITQRILKMMSAIVVLIEMIVFKHVICPNKYMEYERLRVLFQKITQPFPKTPLSRKPL